MKKKYSWIIKLVISAALIFFVFRNTSISTVLFFFEKYSWSTIALVVALLFLTFLIAAARWKLLLPDLRFVKILRFFLVGLFYSLILPGQLTGEVAKAYRLSSEHPEMAGHISASVAIDKLLGLFGLFVVALFGVIISDMPSKILWVTLIAAMTAVSFFAMVFFANPKIQRIFFKLIERAAIRFHSVTKFVDFAKDVAFQYQRLSKKKAALAISFVLATLYQLVLIVVTYVFSQALDMHVGIFQMFWIYGLISVATFLPITIAGIGVREGLFVYFLAPFGVSSGSAIALSISILAIQVLSAIIGAFCEAYKAIMGLIPSFLKDRRS